MDKEGYHDFGKAPLKAEGEQVSYDYARPRTLEEQLEYYKERLAEARKAELYYNSLKGIARRGQLMVANKDGFTLVEDLDEYLAPDRVMPLSKADIIREGLEQLEEAFGEGYKVDPNVNYKWVKP